MSKLLLFNNLHLGIELAGAIIFFIVAWLFVEAYLIKKDVYSFGRALGFFFLIIWEVIHGVGGAAGYFSPIGLLIYWLGLILIILSYWGEKLPGKPVYAAVFAYPAFFSPLFFGYSRLVTAALLFVTAVILIRRYFKEFDLQIKWLAIGFSILALSAAASIFSQSEFLDNFLIAEHLLKTAALAAVGLWIWTFLSLRLREEALIVFVSSSLFMALLITTVFSALFLQRIQQETKNSLSAGAKVLSFFVESQKNKSLAAGQIIAANSDFVSAVKEDDLDDLRKIAGEFMSVQGLDFLSVAGRDGEIFFKASQPVLKDENILAERIGIEALEGRAAAAIDSRSDEGISIRAAAPIFDRGKIIGAVLAGIRLNETFTADFKKTSDFETTVFSGDKVIASTVYNAGQSATLPKEGFVGSVRFFGEETIGAFVPLRGFDNKTLATLSLTAAPGKLLRDAQNINRLTILVVFLAALGFIVPLYRFAVFLTS